MKLTNVILTIKGDSPYSASRQHDEPHLEGEGKDDYDKRTWRSKLTVGANGNVLIPAFAFHQALVSAAKYSKRQIPGQGKATWTAKFQAGIMVMSDLDLGVKPEDFGPIDISANADGVRGSGKRVPRRFPIISEWSTTFEILILDPIITEDVFREMVELAGLFNGLGRFRPQNGGMNGRFHIERMKWTDNRKLAA